MASTIGERKLSEGRQHMKDAEKSLKTSWLKWKPDWDSAASSYMKAGTCFKVGKAYDQARDAFEKCADAHCNCNALFQAGKALEQAAAMLKELKKTNQAVDCMLQAAQFYREHGTQDTAALVLIRAAKMCENENPDKAVETYMLASELNQSEGKTRESSEPLAIASKLLVRTKRYEKAIEVLKQEGEIHTETENYGAMYQVILALIILHLSNNDYVTADNYFKDSCGVPGFSGSDQAVLAEDMLDAFEKGDAEAMSRATSNQLLNYFRDNEMAKLARSLRVPGDSGKPSQIQTPLSISETTSAEPPEAGEEETPAANAEEEDLSCLL